MTGKLLDPRLTIRQIIALGFAPDAEFVAMAKRAADPARCRTKLRLLAAGWGRWRAARVSPHLFQGIVRNYESGRLMARWGRADYEALVNGAAKSNRVVAARPIQIGVRIAF